MPRHRKRKLSPEQSGHTRAAIIRKYRSGYRLPTIASELEISIGVVSRVLHASGVCWSSLSVRDRYPACPRTAVSGVSDSMPSRNRRRS